MGLENTDGQVRVLGIAGSDDETGGAAADNEAEEFAIEESFHRAGMSFQV